MTRFLLLGDMAPTGFGTVTMDLGRALLDEGTDVRFLAFNESDDLPEPFASRTAKLGHPEGWLAAQAVKSRLVHLMDGALFADEWVPDVALVLGDVGSLIESDVTAWFPENLPAWHYAPIEGVSLPPRWRRWWDRFSPIAMSKFGAAEIAKVTGSEPPMVYHGVDTSAFYPVSPTHPITWLGAGQMVVLRSRTECKRAFGFSPDDILILRTDANVVRKAYFDLFWALAPVVEHNPRVKVAVHAKIRDFGGDMADMLSHYPETIRRRMGPMHLHEQLGFVPRPVLAALYNAADIYVSNACEGFGLTIAEALACGVPAVGMDWSAVPEVIGMAGLTVPAGRMYPNIYSHLWAVADGDALGKAVQTLVDSKGLRRRLGDLGPIHVGANFQWSKAAREFLAVMAPTQAEAVAA